MMTLSKSQKQRAIEQMHELMQRHPLDGDGMTEGWLNAESLLESYVSAVEEKTADIPPRQKLGEACFYLISAVGLVRDGDNIQLVSELLTPEFGVELYGLLPRVKRLFDDALKNLAALAKTDAKVDDARPHTDFDLF